MPPGSEADHALAQVGVDPRTALAEADAIVARLPRPRTPDDVREVATAQRAAGLALRSLGDPTAAERRMRSGVALAERRQLPEVAAEVRMSLAFVLLELGRTRAALAATDHSLSVLRGVKAARVRTIRALVLQHASRDREAYAEYDAALAVLRRAHDADWEARLRHNRALLSIELGRTRDALADLEWTRDYDLRAGHTTDAADALFNMGVALEHAGDIPAALELFDRADVEWAGVERPERWMSRVDAYLAVGLVSEAAVYAQLAVDRLDGRGWDSLEAQARLQLAVCHLSFPKPALAEARRHASRSGAMFAAQNRPEAQSIADYVLLKATLLEDPTTRDLDSTPEVAARLRDTGGDGQAADLRITAGRIAIERGDLARARVLLGPLTADDRSRLMDVRTRAWFARALLAEADGRDHEADGDLRRAWKVVDSQRALLGATELRAASATHAASLVSSAARLALRSHSARDAFDWAERGRTAVLRHSPVSPPRDPELAEALARYRWAARNDEEARLDGALDRDATTSRVRGEAAVLRLTRRNAGDHPGLVPATAREVRDRLRGETFVQLLEVEGTTYAVVLGRRRPALVALAQTADITSALATTMFGLRRTLVGFGRAASRAASAAAVAQGLLSLDARLVGPLRSLLDEGGVTVCPTASLASVPWSALPSLRGRVVRVAPSATSWCRARDAEPGPRSVVAVAGPGLPGAEAEVCSVAALHEGAVALVGARATVGAVLEATSGASLLHLAAHGRLRTDNPLFSALELVDGPLTAYDLESLPHAPATVVLSACSSGAGHATVGEETLGLAWTLLGLGSASVVAPLLPVPDEATRAVMVALHRHLAAGAAGAEALSAAAAEIDPDDPVAAAVTTAFVAYGA